MGDIADGGLYKSRHGEPQFIILPLFNRNQASVLFWHGSCEGLALGQGVGVCAFSSCTRRGQGQQCKYERCERITSVIGFGVASNGWSVEC